MPTAIRVSSLVVALGIVATFTAAAHAAAPPDLEGPQHAEVVVKHGELQIHHSKLQSEHENAMAKIDALQAQLQSLTGGVTAGAHGTEEPPKLLPSDDDAKSTINLGATQGARTKVGTFEYLLVGQGACVNVQGSHGTYHSTTTASSNLQNCEDLCDGEATCTGFDDRSGGCLWYSNLAITSSNGNSGMNCYRKLDLRFNTAQSDDNSPISDTTSICAAWYISDGPVFHGSNEAAADALKSSSFTKATATRSGVDTMSLGNPAWDGNHNGADTSGSTWAVGYKRGCTEVSATGSSDWIICGCSEMWCPTRGSKIHHPDDAAYAGRTKCYSSKAVFGCYRDNVWLHGCGWQKPGTFVSGAGTWDGLWVASWEQMLL